jgi:hypothetical protein
MRPGAVPDQTKETNMTSVTANKRPTHDILQVISTGDKSRWFRVGAAWPNRDGKGFYLKFTSVPVSGNIHIREITKREEQGQE